MTRIIAVRHAQSEGNLANFCCGHTDVALTPLGHLQSAETARYIAEKYRIDCIYSSDLIRVVMTARPMAELLGMELIPCKALREIDVGDWDGLPHSEVDRRWVEERHLWHSDFVNAYCPGGESVRELFARIKSEMRRIADENPGKTVAVFTHATPVRSMLTEWHRQPIEAINTTPWPGNASVTVVDYHDDGSYTVVEEAYDAHLHEAGLIDAAAAAYEKADAKKKKEAV